MEAVDREEEERRPGHVEDGEEHRRAGQPLHRLEILEAGGGLRALARQHRAAQAGAEHLRCRAGLHRGADPRRDAAADVVEHAHDGEERGDQDGEGEQRLDASRLGITRS